MFKELCYSLCLLWENHLDLSRCKKMHTLLCEEVNINNNRILPLPNPRHMNKLYLPARKYVIPLWDSLNTFIRACSIDNIQKQFQITFIRKFVMQIGLWRCISFSSLITTTYRHSYSYPPAWCASAFRTLLLASHIHCRKFCHLNHRLGTWNTTSARFQGKPSCSNRRMSIYLFLVALD